MSRRPMQHNLRRRCFTLVELLVVMAIIGLLASMILMALAGAGETAKRNRTTAQITKLNEIVMRRWDGYRTRPLPVRTADVVQRFGIDPQAAPKYMPGFRLGATWELMRMELPERKNDLLPMLPGNKPNWFYLKTPPALWLAYQRRIQAVCGPNWTSDDPANGGWSRAHQGAECLYLIISTLRDDDTSALAYFSQSEIGDVDGDKMPEILDGWGNPIEFLRWAPGFVSVIPPPPDSRLTDAAPTKRQTGDPINQHCPFDVLKSRPEAFALYPLIYSAGPDGGYDVDVGGYKPSETVFDLTYVQHSPPNNPYFTLTAGPEYFIPGMLRDANLNGVIEWTDNLTNHFIEVQ